MTLPPEVLPMANLLRGRVNRPDTNGMFGLAGTDRPCMRFKGGCCPLGLFPGADRTPISAYELGINLESLPVDIRNIIHTNVYSFINWWDKLNAKEAKDAVTAIWNYAR